MKSLRLVGVLLSMGIVSTAYCSPMHLSDDDNDGGDLPAAVYLNDEDEYIPRSPAGDAGVQSPYPHYRAALLPPKMVKVTNAVRNPRSILKRSSEDAGFDGDNPIRMDLREYKPRVLFAEPVHNDQAVSIEQYVTDVYNGQVEVDHETIQTLGLERASKNFIRKAYSDDRYLYLVLRLCKVSKEVEEAVRNDHLESLRNGNMRAKKGHRAAIYNMWYMYRNGIIFPNDGFSSETFANKLPKELLEASHPGKYFVYNTLERPNSDTQLKLEQVD